MKRLALAAFLAFGTCVALPAQQPSFLTFNPAAQPSALSAPGSFNFTLVPELAPPLSASPSFPASPKSPAPQGSTPSEDVYRWDLALGYEFFHFHSAPFSANLNGLHTDLTYNVNNWFGIEGSLVSAFGGSVFSGEIAKSVLYTAGGRVSAGPSRRRWTPWAHVLIGGIHMFPQVAHEGRNGFALQLGGGADWAYTSRIAFRAEGDYVRTMLYSSSQNNFQLGIGAVVHF
jgi:hypothetical protein